MSRPPMGSGWVVVELAHDQAGHDVRAVGEQHGVLGADPDRALEDRRVIRVVCDQTTAARRGSPRRVSSSRVSASTRTHEAWFHRSGADAFRGFVVELLLSSNMGEVRAVFLGVVLAVVIGLSHGADQLVLPLLATQTLWINLLTDTAPALAMGVDPGNDDVMSRPPRSMRDRVIDGRMWAECCPLAS